MSWQIEQEQTYSPDQQLALAEESFQRRALLHEAANILMYSRSTVVEVLDIVGVDLVEEAAEPEVISEVFVEIRQTPAKPIVEEPSKPALKIISLPPAGQTAKKLAQSRTVVQPKPRQAPVSLPTKVKKPAQPKLRRERRDGVSNPWNDDFVRAYLKDIGRHPLLTKDEEVELSRAVHAGQDAAAEYNRLLSEGVDNHSSELIGIKRTIRAGENAKERFVNSNLRLVVSVAKRYTKSGVPLLDLIQEGNLGMMHAVDKFDWRKGFKFSTYATWWIRQAITRGIADKSRTIRLPVHKSDDVRLLRMTEERFETDSEIAEEMGITLDALQELRLVSRMEPISYDKSLTEDNDSDSMLDLLGDPRSNDAYEEVETNVAQAKILDTLRDLLDPREFFVIAERFGLLDGEPKTLETIALTLTAMDSHVTRQRVQQIQTIAMRRLKHPAAYSAMSVLHESREDEWKSLADCRDVPLTEIFMPAIEHPRGRPRNIPRNEIDPRRKICEHCSVKERCYQLARLLRVDKGLWAGEIYSHNRKIR